MRTLKVVLLSLSIVALAACGNSQSTTPLPVKEITLDAQDIAFGTTIIEVAVGQPVKLTLNNIGVLEHDFNIEQISVSNVHSDSDAHAGHGEGNAALHVAAEPGGSATLEFTPTQAGTYEFSCTTAGHKEAGMVGILIVN